MARPLSREPKLPKSLPAVPTRDIIPSSWTGGVGAAATASAGNKDTNCVTGVIGRQQRRNCPQSKRVPNDGIVQTLMRIRSGLRAMW
jgi:hypothetical protein